MKKLRKIFLSLTLVLVACSSLLVGCGPIVSGGPNLNDAITSNGGTVVQKGNYLYFVNGYEKEDTAVNKKGQVYQSAIYRAQLDKDNNLQYDEDGNLKNVDRLVSRVAGFGRTSLYVFGDNLYYVSPNTDRNKGDGEIDTNLLDFYKIALNGTNEKALYKTTVSSTNTQFEYYQIDGQVYLAIFDSKNLIVINASTGNKLATIEDVSSCVLPKQESVISASDSLAENKQNIFYTRSAKEDEDNKTPIICSMNIKQAQEQVIADANVVENCSLKSFNYINEKTSYVLFTKGSSNAYYSAKVENGNINFNTSKKMSVGSLSNNVLLYAEPTSDNSKAVLVTTNSNGELMIVSLKDEYNEDVKLFSEYGNVTLNKIAGTKVFFYNEKNQLMVLDLANLGEKAIQLTNSESTYNFEMAVNFDACGEYVYVYKTFTGDKQDDKDAESGSYLVRIKFEHASSYEDEVVGKLLDKHIKTEEDTETEE